MAGETKRTVDQIREEIRIERGELDVALAALGAGAKRSGRVAGIALGTLGGALLLVRRRRRRRSR